MSGKGKTLEAHEIIENLESELKKREKDLFYGFFLGVLSEVNFLLNEIFWDFFSRGKRRREFVNAVGGEGFWLNQTGGGGSMVRRHLDCLGKKHFTEGLGEYFEALPHKKEHFNEQLRMRFLIFYKGAEDFLKEVEALHKLRDYLAHPKPENKPSGEELKLSLYSLCRLVHPVFFGLLKGKVRTLAGKSRFAGSVDEAFGKIQKERRKTFKSQRGRFFGEYKTRESQGRAATRSWSCFEKRWEGKRQKWGSGYRLHNFIYQYRRINPEGIREFACQRAGDLTPSFRDVEEIHGLLSALDLLFWEYVPHNSEVPREVRDLRNCLAHNEKVGASTNRRLAKEFGVLLNRLDPVSANSFYTKAESILKKRNHKIDAETGKKVRYRQGKPYCKSRLENPKLLRCVAASIKRDLKKARSGK